MTYLKYGILALLILVSGLSPDVRARERIKKPKGASERSRAFFEVKYGRVGPGSVTVEGDEDDLTSSYVIGASLDFPIYRGLNIGGEISVFNFKYDVPAGFNIDASRDVLSGLLITRYSILSKESQFVLRPGLGVGIGYLQEPFKGLDETKYLLWLASVEVGGMVSKKFGLGIELGLLGGKDSFGTEYDVSAGPFPVIRAILLSR